MEYEQFLRDLPKVELHCHFAGTVSAPSLVDLAEKYDVELPPHEEPEDLYDYDNIQDFFIIYDKVAEIAREPEDFERLTYETLGEAAQNGVRHREMFFNPTTHQDAGVPYETVVDGMIAGIERARDEWGIDCRLIPAVNRMAPPELAYEMVRTVLDHPREEVIGIGMDYAEPDNPPEQFWKAYRLAGGHGLHLTAHASEDAHPRNVETCLDLLDCERIDHGYHILKDDELVERCRDEGVVFTVCPTSTAWVYGWSDLSEHPIREMAERDLKIMINSDDPPMFKTEIGREYVVMARHMDFAPEDFKQFVLNGIDGAWVPDPTKRQWREEWSREIDQMIEELDGTEL